MPLVRHKIKRYGRVPDTADQRDHPCAAPLVNLKKLPPKVDLRPQCPQVIYDQGQLGSCTDNAIACAIQFDRLKQKRKPDFIQSRRFIYYNEHNMEGAVGYNDMRQRFIVRNSWGTSWGLRDYFTMPYAYLTDSSLANDFWTIRVVAH